MPRWTAPITVTPLYLETSTPPDAMVMLNHSLLRRAKPHLAGLRGLFEEAAHRGEEYPVAMLLRKLDELADDFTRSLGYE